MSQLLVLMACTAGETSVSSPDTGTATVPVPIESSDTLPEVEVVTASARQPFNANEALFDIELSDVGAAVVGCRLQSDPREVHLVESADLRGSHTLVMSGLLADSSYDCVVGAPPTATPLTVSLTTPPLTDPGLPEIELALTTEQAGRDYIVTNHERFPYDGERPLVLDRDANIRWHAKLGSASAVSYLPSVQRFSVAGTWPPRSGHRLRLIHPLGGEITYDLAEHLADAEDTEFHHDARRLADGRVLTLEERPHLNANGDEVRAFATRLVAEDSGEVLFDYHAERGYLEGHLLGRRGNSYHANWVNLYEIGGQEVVHVSLCGPSLVVAYDVPSGDWRWAFGTGGDFALVDLEGNAIDRFPECQHGLQREGDRLLVYDNGKVREQSRVVEYELDESTMTATELWSWTEEGWYESNLGGVDWTTERNVLVVIGHRESISPSPGALTRFVEIDPSTGEKLWEAHYPDVNSQAFRGESLNPCAMFANARFCDEVGERIEALGPALAGL